MTIIKKGKHSLVFLIVTVFLFASLNAQENQIKLKVVSELANIRDKADIGSTIIFQALQGAVFTSLGKEEEWYHIEYIQDSGDTINGYVHESLVSEIKPPAAEQEEEKPERKAEESVEIKEARAPKPIILEQKTVPSAIAKRPPFSISFSGGGNYGGGGDINKGAEGWVDYNLDDLQLETQQNFKPVQLSYFFGGEISFAINEALSFGFGADYLFGSKNSSFELSGISPETSLTVRPEIQALPLRAFLSCSVLPQLYVKSGVEYFMAKCSYLYRSEEGEAWKEWQGDASSRGLGIMAGLGYTISINSNISLFIETNGRIAKLNNFEGTHTYQDSEGLEYTEEGSLYIYDGHTSEEISYPLLFIRDKKPSEAGVSNPKNAEIDFSGVSLMVGIKLKF